MSSPIDVTGPRLSEDAFWALIQQTVRPFDTAQAQLERLEAVLTPLSESELLESLRAVCPRTFAKWWGNDRF